jgi:hypothetical protein
MTMLEIDSEMTAFLDGERRGLRDLLLQIADMRECDPEAARDPRYGDAAGNLRHLAATIVRVDDELLLTVALLARAVQDHGAGDLVAELISAKLLAVGFEIEPFADATAFLKTLTDVAGVAHARAMGGLN